MGVQPREQPTRNGIPPVRVPAVLCATPWQRWLERMAEKGELEVRYDAAPYPPPGRSGVSPAVTYLSGDGRTQVRYSADGRVMAAPPNPGRQVRA